MNVFQPLTSIDSDSRTELDVEDKSVTCPMCRKMFYVEDVEHVLDLFKNGFPQEVKRRKELEAVLRVQEHNKGLVEAGKTMYCFGDCLFWSLPAHLSTSATDAFIEQQDMGTTTNHFIEETGDSFDASSAYPM